MKHPDTKQTITVDDEMVANYEAQGWRKVAPPKKRSNRKK